MPFFHPTYAELNLRSKQLLIMQGSSFSLPIGRCAVLTFQRQGYAPRSSTLNHPQFPPILRGKLRPKHLVLILILMYLLFVTLSLSLRYFLLPL